MPGDVELPQPPQKPTAKIDPHQFPTINHSITTGGGVLKDPLRARASVKINQVLEDVQHLANSTGQELCFSFNGQIVTLNKYMEPSFEKPDPDNPIQKLIKQKAEELRKKGVRALRPDEIKAFQKELKK